MKKIFFSLLMVIGFTAVQAQVDSLRDYTGKYKFPEGSPVTEISVTLENGVLAATSVMGNSELRKTDTKDVYEIVAFGGTATFKRNSEGRIASMLVQVQDVTMEGTKTDGIALLLRKQHWRASSKVIKATQP